MTDLEITKACAVAMGYVIVSLNPNYIDGVVETDMAHHEGTILIERHNAPPRTYKPIHDDAQAMALVKKFGLWIIHPDGHTQTQIVVFDGKKKIGTKEDLISGRHDTDLNRAICECVAKMKERK